MVQVFFSNSVEMFFRKLETQQVNTSFVSAHVHTNVRDQLIWRSSNSYYVIMTNCLDFCQCCEPPSSHIAASPSDISLSPVPHLSTAFQALSQCYTIAETDSKSDAIRPKGTADAHPGFFLGALTLQHE